MEEIILTGYGKEEYLKKKNVKPRCYLCKREVGEKGVFVIEKSDGKTKLHFDFFEVIEADKKFQFFLCQECQLLLSKFVKKDEPPRPRFSMSQN